MRLVFFMILIMLVLSFMGSLQAEELPPTVIFAEDPETETPRASMWPASTKPLNKTSALPQLEETLNTLGGVQTRFEGSPSISMRGSGQSGRVLTLFNDIPLNFATGFGPPEILFPREIIGNVLIVKGPSSLFYGSQAMSGSLNFQPEVIKKSELRLGISDTDNSFWPWTEGRLAQHNLTFVSPILKSKTHKMTTSVFTEYDDGEFPFQSSNLSGIRSHNKKKTQRATLLGGYRSGALDLNYNFIWGHMQRETPGAINSPVNTDEESRGFLVSLAPSLELTESLKAKLRTHFIKMDSDFKDSMGGARTDQQTTIVQSELRWAPLSKLEIQAFNDYFFHEIDASYISQRLTEDRFESGALATFFLSDYFRLQAGGRYLFHDENSISNLGLIYELGRSKSWLNYSQGFRSPTLSDKFSNSPFFQGNPNLQSEKSQQVELGYAFNKKPGYQTTTFKSLFDGEIRIFHIAYKDFIETQTVSPGVFTKTNRGDGTAHGVDLGMGWSYGPWKLKAVYNFLETEDGQTKESFRLSPKHQMSFGLMHFIGPFYLEAQNIIWNEYYDRDLASNLVRLEDWSQWNFAFHSYGFNRWNFAIGVRNAFNVSKQLTLNFPEPQRRYWAQVRYTF